MDTKHTPDWGYTLSDALSWYRKACDETKTLNEPLKLRCIVAAAPELLKALKEAMRPFDCIPTENLLFDWQREARSAIAKAEGKYNV